MAKIYMKYRHIQQWLPFRLGQDYGQECYQAGEHRFDWWWYDKDYWERRFKKLSEEGFNGICFWNVHPFPALIRYKEYPEAAFFSEEEIEKNISHFKWMIKKGKECGIEIILMEYIIHCSPGFGKSHNLPFVKGRGWGFIDTSLLREYNRYCHEELFKTYPDLGGLMTCWEAAQDNVGFLEECIIDVLNKLKKKPKLFVRLWGAHFAENIQWIIDKYKGQTILCHKMSRENIFKPIADTRFSMWKKDTKGAPIMAIFGPGNACAKNLNTLFWADPKFTKDIFTDLHRKGGEGIGYFAGFDNWIGRGMSLPREPLTEAMRKYREVMWLEEEAVGKYSKNPSEKYDRDYWVDRIVQRYELEPKDGKSLFRAVESCSSIVPRYCCLIDRDYGTPFGVGGILGVLGSWTVSCSDFKGDFGLLGGYAYPFHIWDKEKILSIPEYARDPNQKGTSPLKIANELEKNSIISMECLEEVKQAKKNESLRTLKDYIALNAYFGRYSSEKIKAGVNLYSIIFSRNKREAVKKIKEGIENLKGSVIFAGEFVKLGRRIPMVEMMGMCFLREIEESIPLVKVEIKKWEELKERLKTVPICFETIKSYWLSWDCYNNLHYYIKECHHIQETRINWAKKDLNNAIKNARASLEKVKIFPKVEKNIQNWLCFLKDERDRLDIPWIECAGKQTNWHHLTYNGNFKPPLRFVNQMLSLFVQKKITHQKRHNYYETRPIENPNFRFKISYDKKYLHLTVEMEKREGTLAIFLNPCIAGTNFYQYSKDLDRCIIRENYMELVPPRGLKHSLWESGVKIKEKKSKALTIYFSFPFRNLKVSPKKDNNWGFNICYSYRGGIFPWSSMLGSIGVGAPARFGKLIFGK